jgi:hypothetical protein
MSDAERIRDLERKLAAVVEALAAFIEAVDAESWCQECAIGQADSVPLLQAKVALAAAREQPAQDKLPLGHPFKGFSIGLRFCYEPKQGDYCGQPSSAHQPTQERHEHRFITDEDGCVWPCVCGESYKPEDRR